MKDEKEDEWTFPGKMNDGTQCLVCELWQDLDSADELHLCCKECQDEIAWAFARRRAGDE